MVSKIKVTVAALLVSCGVVAGVAGAANAIETVYFKGKAVAWDHGRIWGVTSFSEVQTGHFEHSATANTTFSGWKKPGVKARAEHFVGLNGGATAYWGCR